MGRQVTPPSVTAGGWRDLLAGVATASAPQALGVRPGQSVLFVGAHPDDETFGAGATLAALARHGIAVHVVTLTRGEAAFDHVGVPRDGLADRRVAEFEAACRTLGATTATALDLPDGGLSDIGQEQLREAVGARVETLAPTHLLTTWWHDPHPDHRAAGAATAAAAREAGLPVSGFGVWAHHWSAPETAPPKESLHVIAHEDTDLAQRRAAASVYASQVLPLTADLDPLLPPWFVAWDVEYAVRG